MQALGGVLVVDLTRYLPGAFASRELLRLGARVVRVEQPGGDPMRHSSAHWHDLLNAGKESVVCELPRERAFARSLSCRGPVEVSQGAAEAGCTVSASEENFSKIIAGEQNPTTAYMTGKLKVKGDMGAAMKLQKLF